MRYVFDIHNDADDACNDVENCHARNDYRRNFGNGLDTTDDDDERKNGKNDTADFFRCTPEGLDCTDNGVCLGHVADTEGSYDCEECEEEAHDSAESFVLESVLHGEHRAALHFALSIHFAVFNSQHTFGEFGSQSEACGNPHPYQCARAAGEHCRCDTDDVAGTDSCCQSRTQCGEWRNVAGTTLGGAGFFRKYA